MVARRGSGIRAESVRSSVKLKASKDAALNKDLEILESYQVSPPFKKVVRDSRNAITLSNRT